MRWLVVALALAGCGASQLPEDAQCRQAVEDLRSYKAMEMPCEVAKARIAADHPSCKLVFVCNLRGKDGGAHE